MGENIFFKPSTDELQKKAGVNPDSLPIDPAISPVPSELPSEPPPLSFLKFFKIALGAIVVLGIIIAVYYLVSSVFPWGKIGKTKLTYWGLFEDTSVMKSIITNFEKIHPEIEIDYSIQDEDQYREKLVVRSENGNGPDIFRFRNTWTPELRSLLLPIPDSVVSKDDFSKVYYPVIQSDLIKNGNIYGIPLGIDTLNLFINKDIFQTANLAAPATWVDFVSDAKQLTVRDENNNITTSGAAMGTYDNIANAPDIISMLFAQNGVDINDMSSNLSAVADALSFYASFVLSPGNSWDSDKNQSVKAFASGSVAMFFGYSRDFLTIKSLNPNLAFDVHPVPALPGKNTTIANYWVEGISAKTQHRKEAILFMQYLSQKDTVKKLFTEESKKKIFGEPYARMDLAENLRDSVIYPFVVAAPSAVSSPFTDGIPAGEIGSQLDNSLRTTINSILEGIHPQEAAESLSEEASPLLRQYGQ